MIYTVRDMLKVIAPYVEGGVSPDCLQGESLESAMGIYNKISEELIKRGEWEHTLVEACFPIADHCFTLPSRFEDIYAYQVNGVSVGNQYFSEGFKYIDPGNWGLTPCDCDGIEDMGDHFGTERDLSRPMRIMAFSNRPEEGAILRIYGTGSNGEQVSSFEGGEMTPGDSITINHATPGLSPKYTDGDSYSDGVFSFVERLSKPVTNGHVKVMGFDPQTKHVEELATLSPGEIRPNYRRIKIANDCGNIRALLSLRMSPLSHPDEISLIQDREAYETYAQALQYRANGKPNEYLAYRNMALASLKAQKGKNQRGKKKAFNIPVSRGPLKGNRYSGPGRRFKSNRYR